MGPAAGPDGAALLRRAADRANDDARDAVEWRAHYEPGSAQYQREQSRMESAHADAARLRALAAALGRITPAMIAWAEERRPGGIRLECNIADFLLALAALAPAPGATTDGGTHVE